ncbi:gephyrin-like molybdotransferase receptor GlpR [Streptomyces sp. ZYX-F-203]
MSSSGLIYAVIVGAWAAYLVPMWLRRQDELNEARPTERFGTAIRLLSGRAAMERRYTKDLAARSRDETGPEIGVAPDGFPNPAPASTEPPPLEPPRRDVDTADAITDAEPEPEWSTTGSTQAARPATPAEAAARARRSRVLARRRRTTVVLFLCFTLGAMVAAVGGLAFLWAPAAPAVLLSTYIGYLRAQERRRFTFQMDRRRAEAAARRLRQRERHPRHPDPAEAETVVDLADTGTDTAADPRSEFSSLAADRRALVEQTDHAEWVDQQRERRRPGQAGDSWEPVPVPLPTYVTAPVAPRATRDVDHDAVDAWSSARSSTAPRGRGAGPGAPATPRGEAPAADTPRPGAEPTDRPGTGARRAASARRSRERGHTPLFDQYEDGDRPKAANE